MSTRRVARVAMAGLFAIASACGADVGSGPPAPTIEAATFSGSLNVDLSQMTKTASGLYYRDLITGGTAVVTAGQLVSVHYAGYLVDGTQFDASQPPKTFTFRVGTGQVIAGWDEGVPGMHVGGRRQLILPPSLGYGAKANGSIPGNSIMVFVVDVVSAQ